MSATDEIIAFASAQHAVPAGVRAAAVRLLGDTLAIGAAAVGAPGEPAILEAAHLLGSGDDARLIGTAQRLPASSAAFVNAYRIHCLEWDAVHEPAVVHVMSTITAALGAAIDRRGGCDPQEALTALCVGVDVAAGLGLSADTPLRFFRPSICGVLGASVAVARFDGAPIADALGLAYSSAAGTMQAHIEGSPALPFQIANAARAAVMASDLARAGFSGPKDPIEGAFGFFELFEKGDIERYTGKLGSVWRIAEVSTKPFPSGRASHAALGKLAELGLDPDDIAAIDLACPPLIRRLVDRAYSPDMAPSWARLCVPFLSALMLTEGTIDPRRFTRTGIADSKLAQIAGRVTLSDDGNEDGNALFPQALTVTLRDGSVQTHTIAHTLGSPENPLSPDQQAAKLALARDLAPNDADPRIFEDPLSYFTESQ